jgi:uncharacterized membrane protein YccF (DUF307 family)
MRLLGNIVWLILGGWVLFLTYTVAAIIFFPLFIPLFRLARYALWPFGRGLVTQSQLIKYREIKSIESKDHLLGSTARRISGVLNILWMLTFGWFLALVHLFSAIFNMFLFFLIVTIPNIGGHWKLIRVAFMPFNKVIVPQSIADEINKELVKNKLNI